MGYNVLGPLTVVRNGAPVPIDAPKQRALLAVLILHANEVVSSDRLLDLVWEGSPGDGGDGKLRFQVSKLRSALESDPGSDGSRSVVTVSPGYMLSVEPEDVDTLRFGSSVYEARRIVDSNPEDALTLLDESLALWRGPAYGEFEYTEWAQPEIRRLTDLRLGAIEDRFDVLLALGRGKEAIGDLQAQVSKNPRRERLRGALMLALYRAGRQADALAVYQDLRCELGEGLGIDPSIELQNLEERILLQDPSLSSDRGSARDRLRGYELLGKVGEGAHGVVHRAAQSGVGREVAIKTIRPELANDASFVRRFEAEAELVASLEHPHIVSLFDFWRDPDGAYLVMPYLRGGNLADKLGEGQMEIDAVMELAGQLGDALAYAHQRGVVHRDVTPENVLLDEGGYPYLADFGVAALLGTLGAARSSSPAYLPPEVDTGVGVSPATDVFSLGVLCHAALTGASPLVGAPLPPVSSLRPGLPVGVDGMVARATATDIAERYGQIDEFVVELDSVLGGATSIAVDVTAEIRNPFKGLRAFKETDADDFFGRETSTDELVHALGRHRLIGVVGPSGCGKSSLVRAGLIPRIRSGEVSGSDRWLVTDMYPGSRPFSEVEAALLRVAVARPEGFTETLTSGADNWLGGVDDLLPKGSEVLLIIDQFEELFTLTVDREVRRRFLEMLTHLASDPLHRIRIIVTMRADFYDRPLEHPGFGDLLRAGLVSVTMPDDESLVKAVIGPAEGVGVSLEAGLADTIVADVVEQPGGLPLMEYALTEMFDRRTGSRLTIDEYHRAGGVLGALGRRAEDLYARADDAGKDAIRHILLRLVAIEEGAADTRRRIAAVEISTLGIDSETLESVLKAYGSHRLLTFDRDPNTRAPTIEVAHEALLSTWERLRIWIDDLRDDLVLQRHLATAVAEWNENDRDDAYLLSPGRLDHYEVFAAETDLALTTDERGYLTQSRTHAEALRTGRRRRRRMVLTGFAAAAVLATVLAVTAYASQQRAEDATEVAQSKEQEAIEETARADAASEEAQKQATLARSNAREAATNAEHAATNAAIARAQELAAKAKLILDEDAELAILLALEAVRIDVGQGPLKEAQEALHQAVVASRVRLTVPGWGRVDLNEAGDRLVTHEYTGPVSVVDTATGERIQTLPIAGDLLADDLTEYGVGISADGHLVATGRTDGTVAIWSVSTGAELITSNDQQTIWTDANGGTFALEFGGEETAPIAVAASADRIEAALENLSQIDDVVVTGAGSEDEPWHVVFEIVGSPYVHRLGADPTLLEPETSLVTVVGRGHDTPGETSWALDGVQAVRFTPDESVLVSRGWDGTIRAWDTTTGEQLIEIDAPIRPGSTLLGMDVSPDGALVAASSPDAVRIWNLETGELLQALFSDISDPADVAFIPGRSALALAGGEIGRAVSIWDWEAGTEHPIADSGSYVTAIAVTSDGKYVAASDDGGWVHVSELSEGWAEGVYALRGNEDVILDLATSGSGLLLASVSEQTVRLMDLGLSGSSEWLTLKGVDVLSAVAYSPDGTMLARGPVGDSVVIIDALDGEEIRRFETLSWQVPDLEFSPDGTRLAIATDSPLAPVQVWDVETGEAVAELGEFQDSGHWPFSWSVRYSPDGSLLGAVVETVVYVWDAATSDLILTIPVEDPEVHAVRELAFHPDGNSIAVRGSSVGPDGVNGDFVNVYDLSGELLRTCCEQWWNMWAASIVYSPDGDLLLTSGMNQQTGEGLVVVWDAETGDEVGALTGHPNTAWDAVFSPDGSLITSSSGPDVRVWDATTFEEIVTLSNPSEGAIWEVAFSPDGRRLVTTGDLGSEVRVWALDLDDLIEIAKSRLTRGFTEAECEAYGIDPCPAGL